MNVTLLTKQEHFADMEYFTALAALTCHDNTDKDFVPAEVLKRRIKENHGSVLEHINLTYSIKGISRALLQELSRHRHISLSVESTRFTLRKKLEDGIEHYPVHAIMVQVPGIDTKFNLFDELFSVLGNIAAKNPDFSNDELKYYIPEFWPTNLILTSNVRELRHILNLRTAPQALKEFRDLAHQLFNVVPEQFKYLLQDCVHEEVNNA